MGATMIVNKNNYVGQEDYKNQKQYLKTLTPNLENLGLFFC